MSAFAAFDEGAVIADLPGAFIEAGGVRRWNCSACGSPLGAAFDYLPAHVYVPLGIIDQAATLAPVLHSHHASRMPWLHISDNLPRHDDTARAALAGRAP